MLGQRSFSSYPSTPKHHVSHLKLAMGCLKSNFNQSNLAKYMHKRVQKKMWLVAQLVKWVPGEVHDLIFTPSVLSKFWFLYKTQGKRHKKCQQAMKYYRCLQSGIPQTTNLSFNRCRSLIEITPTPVVHPLFVKWHDYEILRKL